MVIAASVLLGAPTARATSDVYSDDFSGPTKPLDSRKTAAKFGAWEADPTISAGEGMITVDQAAEGNSKLCIKMPSLAQKSRLKLKIRCRTSGAASDSHISFGFTPSEKSDLLTQGALWIIDRSDSFALMYLTGPGATNQFVGNDWYGGFARDNTQETEHILDYDLKKGLVTVSVENNGNQRTLVENSPVNWDGTANQPVPLDDLAYFMVSFYQQEGRQKGADASYIKSIELEVLDH